jgi:hypothetical protein
MVEGNRDGRNLVTDIYTMHRNDVERLTDGFIRADIADKDPKKNPGEWGRPHLKRGRDARFPLTLVSEAMGFALSDATTSEPADSENILAYVRGGEGGEDVVNSTFRARCFIAVLPLLKGSAMNTVDANKGFEALRGSVLTKLPLSQLPTIHTASLLSSLPQTLVELLLPGSDITDEHAIEIGAFLRGSKALKVLRLGSNGITHVGAKSLGDALHVNTSLTLLNLGSNEIGTEGVVAIAGALKENKDCALRVLWIDVCACADTACTLGLMLVVMAVLR